MMSYTRPALFLPAGLSRAGVELSLYPIMAALTLFKITRPVRIKWAGGYGAAHRGDKNGHRITLSTNEVAKTVSDFLWHELGHAWQAERFPDPAAFMDAYIAAGGRDPRTISYERNRYEIEANKIEAAYGRFLLASGGGATKRLQPGFEWRPNPEVEVSAEA